LSSAQSRDAWWIKHGPLSLALVPQLGGGIMSLRWHGRELAFVNRDCEGQVRVVAAIADIHE
jgi:hypothetical protein